MSRQLDFAINTGRSWVVITQEINKGLDITFSDDDYVILEEIFLEEQKINIKSDSKDPILSKYYERLGATEAVSGISVLHDLTAIDAVYKIRERYAKILYDIESGRIFPIPVTLKDKIQLIMDLCHAHPKCKIIVEGEE